MNWMKLVTVAVVVSGAPVVAAELSLFDIDLRTATPLRLHQAAVAAGAQPLNKLPGHRLYDATKLGLPGAQRLELLFDGEVFVAAAYTFDERSRNSHELRRLLVAKYGAPYLLLNGKRHEPDITGRYFEFGTVRWGMGEPMELVYTEYAPNPRKFGGFETRLTYLNRAAFEMLEQRNSSERDRADKARAAHLRKAF